MTAASRFLVIILVVLGVLAIAAGIIYFAEPASSLPAFFPGHVAHLNQRHTRRGLAGIIVGAVLLINRSDHRTCRQAFFPLLKRWRAADRTGW